MFKKLFKSNVETVNFDQIYLSAISLLNEDQIISLCCGYDAENGAQLLNLLLEHIMVDRKSTVCGYGLNQGIDTMAFIQSLKDKISFEGMGVVDMSLWTNIFYSSFRGHNPPEIKDVDGIEGKLIQAFRVTNESSLGKLTILKDNILSGEESSIVNVIPHKAIYLLLAHLGKSDVYNSKEYAELVVAVLKTIPSIELSSLLRLDSSYLQILSQMRDVCKGETGRVLEKMVSRESKKGKDKREVQIDTEAAVGPVVD